jgi:hypothetical protein
MSPETTGADRIIALLDAIADAPLNNASVHLHDYDGTVIGTLLSWSAAHGFDVTTRPLTLSDRTWYVHDVKLVQGYVTVHDEQSSQRLPPRDFTDGMRP